MHEAAQAEDRRGVAEIDASLHEQIVALSGNKTLLRVWRSLEPLSRTYITLIGPRSDPAWTAHLHDPILDAIKNRDSKALIVAIQRHFDEVREWLAASFADPS
jgi:DNA-binding GntR family transcriptional regulator